MRCRSKLTCSIAVLLSLTGAVWADSYRVEITADRPRVAYVEAELVPRDGIELLLSRNASDTGLYHGWATFLHEIEVTDGMGEIVPVEYLPGGRFRLARRIDSPVAVRYTMLLQHDRFPNLPGADELAWARPDSVLWTGRALFLEGAPAQDISVRFELADGWRATTPWEVVAPGRSFRAADVDALLDSAVILGRHDETLLGEGADAPVRIALAGEHAESKRDEVVRIVEHYLDVFGDLLATPPRDRLLLAIADGSFWGGGVMGSSISMLLGGELDESTLPVLRFITVHELFHLWNAAFAYDEPAGLESLYWMSEGTATYYAWRAQLGAGDLDPERLFDLFAEEVSKYMVVAGDRSLVAAGVEKLDNEALIYSGGLLASLGLDVTIRRGSDDRYSLDDVMRRLAESRADEVRGQLDVRRFGEIVRQTTGVSVDEYLERYVLGTETLPLADLLAELGLDLAIERGADGLDAAVSVGRERPAEVVRRWEAWPLG